MEGRQMAKTGRGTTARRNRNTVRNSREMYVQGNAVKRLQEVPRRTDLHDVQASAGPGEKTEIRSSGDTCEAGCEQEDTAEQRESDGHE